MAFISNSNGNVAVDVDQVKAVKVQGLLIVFKMETGADLVFEEAGDSSELETLKTRTWGLLPT